MQHHTCINNNQVQGSSSSTISQISQANKWVVNLSKLPLIPAQESLLSKGPNFALAPTNPPNVEFISAVESACQKLLVQDAQKLRAEVNYLLKRPNPLGPTLPRKRALKELREDQDRMVLTGDKRVAMVVMDRKENMDKGVGLLAQLAYKTISSGQTS